MMWAWSRAPITMHLATALWRSSTRRSCRPRPKRSHFSAPSPPAPNSAKPDSPASAASRPRRYSVQRLSPQCPKKRAHTAAVDPLSLWERSKTRRGEMASLRAGRGRRLAVARTPCGRNVRTDPVLTGRDPRHNTGLARQRIADGRFRAILTRPGFPRLPTTQDPGRRSAVAEPETFIEPTSPANPPTTHSRNGPPTSLPPPHRARS